MALAFTRWGLAPDAFWRLTPCEIAAALDQGVPHRPAPLDAADLARLVRRFPDGEPDV